MSEEFETCEGGCTCGQVRYKVHSKQPLIVHACHCRWCQRQTGGPHVINALCESKFIELINGEVETTTVPTPKGAGQTIARCPHCKDALWSNYLTTGMGEHLRFLRVGTLDEPNRMPPDVHIYTSSMMPWYVIPDNHYAVEEFHDYDTTWRPESHERNDARRKELGMAD